MKTARVHHAARRRGGCVAARGTRAAGRASAAHRRAHGSEPRTIRNVKARYAAFLQRLQQLGWTDGRNVRIDARWAGRRCRTTSQVRGGIGRARAGRHPGRRHVDRRAVAASDPHRADRVRRYRRSGRRRLRRQPGAAGRQRHRLHAVRIQSQREMAGAAQRDRTERDACGGPSGSRHHCRDRPVRRHSVRSAVARDRREPGQRARRPRDRARRRGICARPEWRPDRDRERAGGGPSRSDHHAGGPAQAASGLPARSLSPAAG